MGKRSDFQRALRNLYNTPLAPVQALSEAIRDVECYAEPFVGQGALVRALASLGHVLGFACDIHPEGPAQRYAETRDALTVTWADLKGVSHIITNPPWPEPRKRGEPTVSFIHHLARLKPTWVLLAADFMHNVYAVELMDMCVEMVSVGRVRWIAGTKNDGFENACWYLFDAGHIGGPNKFRPNTRPSKIMLAAILTDIL